MQYPSPDIPTSPEEGYEEGEDGLRQEMMSVLLPYLQASAEGAPGSVEGEAEFHENNVIVEGRPPTDLINSLSLSSDENDELLFSKRFNKRLNMHAPPEEPMSPHDLEGRNTSSKVLSSQILRNVTIESIAHLVATATPQQRGTLDVAPDPARSQYAPLDNSMAVTNPETEGTVGHDALFPSGDQRFSKEPHHNGNEATEEAGNSQSESVKREAVREEMPPRDLLKYQGMHRISQPEHPMYNGDGNALASFSPPVFKSSDFYSSSTENITGTSDPENLGANTIDPTLFSHYSVQPEFILQGTEQRPQTLQTGSSQSLSPSSRSTEVPLQSQSVSEVPWFTKFDPALPSSTSDLQSGLDENRDQFQSFQYTTSGSVEAAMPIVGDANNIGSTPLSNAEKNALGSTFTTLVTEEITDYLSRKSMFRQASSSSTRKLTSKLPFV